MAAQSPDLSGIKKGVARPVAWIVVDWRSEISRQHQPKHPIEERLPIGGEELS
jgi:hypothetical protein